MSETASLPGHICESIAQRKLFQPGDAIMVAVSGGLDSMVLLHLLAGMANAQRWRLTVAHFNHQLRGRSSDADERLTKLIAKKLRLPFVSGRADVRQFAREKKLSLEMAARKLRHAFLATEASKRKIRRIALAHHADDQVELFFLRLLRGAGSEGLAGMKWQSPSPANLKIKLVRPLLDQPKSVLAAYAMKGRILFREDATNAQLDIQRNRIRHELLPLLRKQYQPALERVILRQMELIGAEADLVTQSAMDWLKGKHFPDFEKLPVAIQRRCLQLQLLELGVRADFDLIETLRRSPKRPVCASPMESNAKTLKSIHVVAVQMDTSGMVHVCEAAKPSFLEGELEVCLEGSQGEILFENARIRWKRISLSNGIFSAHLRPVNYEIFDADKVGSDIVLRHWKPGDRFQPIGMSKAVKLQDLFTNQKIPRAKRHELFVAATVAGEVFWVEGLRMGERFKLDKNTSHGLKWGWNRLW